MDTPFGWLIALAIAAYLLRPVWRGFFEGLHGDDGAPQGSGSGHYSSEVVGESHYQRNLLKLAGRREPDGVEKFMTAALVLEDDNPHDSNAVRVDIDGRTVGYLPRDRAKAWRRGAPRDRYECPAVIRGGWDRGGDDRGHFGVWLDLP